MRKRDGYRKIQIVETDSEYSNASICNINKSNFFLILIIIIIYIAIVLLLFKAFFIYAEIKDPSLEKVNKKNNLKTKNNYTDKVNIMYNISKTERKSTYFEVGNSSNNANTSRTIIEVKKTEKLVTTPVLNSFTKEINPKISILILIEEKQNLEQLLWSLQNQKFDDFELLIIYDNTTNYNSSLYNRIKSHDKRVRLIEYKNKVGNLKKRNDAINESKGEYIIFIDSDDYFISNENSFQEIYNKAVENKIDILEFKSFHFIPNDNNIIYQPRLFDLMYFSTDNFCNIKEFHLSGKLIKKSFLIETFKNIDNYYFEKDMNYFEENLILLILLKKAKSFLFFLNALRTAKFCSNNEINFYFFNQHNKRDFLLYLKFLIQKTDNNVPEKRLVSSFFINFVVRKGIKFTEKEEIELLNENINLLLNCKKINDNDHAIMEFYQKDYL